MRDDLAAPERRLRPRPWHAPRRRGPLDDDLLEPDWAALAPAGLVRRRLGGPVGDGSLSPDWRWQPPADAVLLRRALIGPIGDDVLPTDWTAPAPVLRLGRGPIGDNVVRPDDEPVRKKRRAEQVAPRRAGAQVRTPSSR
jgi:hypothetical protein